MSLDPVSFLLTARQQLLSVRLGSFVLEPTDIFPAATRKSTISVCSIWLETCLKRRAANEAESIASAAGQTQIMAQARLTPLSIWSHVALAWWLYRRRAVIAQ